jgi:hypothetical protein
MRPPKKLPRGVYPRGNNYYIRYADQYGKIQRECIGPFLELAKSAVEKRRCEVREGTFFPEKLKSRFALFGEVAGIYFKLAKKRRSWKDAEDHLQTLKSLNDVPLAEITPARIEGVLNRLQEEREWAPATWNRHRSTVSGVFRCAIREGKAQ